jgi:hypothetical protein
MRSRRKLRHAFRPLKTANPISNVAFFCRVDVRRLDICCDGYRLGCVDEFDQAKASGEGDD